MKSRMCPLCSLSLDELSYWAEKRYIERVSTVELIKLAKTDKDKEIITIVGMLDVDDESLSKIGEEIDEHDCNIFSCRDKLRKLLEEKYHYIFTR